MFKKNSLLSAFVIAMAILVLAPYNNSNTFSCESQYSIMQVINKDALHSEGFITFISNDRNIFIRIDGLLTKNDEKYIISRSINIGYKNYNIAANLYQITKIQTFLDNSDNIDEEIADDLLFDTQAENKLFYLNKKRKDMIFFGNRTFPQYGCKRN